MASPWLHRFPVLSAAAWLAWRGSGGTISQCGDTWTSLQQPCCCFQGDYGQSQRFCASDGPPVDFYSYGRTVLVHFKSDAFLTGNGLNFTFQVAGECTCSPVPRRRSPFRSWAGCLHVLSVHLLSGCSRTFEQAFGYLKSPGWPEVYPHQLDCTILLKAPQNSTISLFFNSFDVESHPSCQFDYLEVSVDAAASQSPGILMGQRAGERTASSGLGPPGPPTQACSIRAAASRLV